MDNPDSRQAIEAVEITKEAVLGGNFGIDRLIKPSGFLIVNR